MQLFGQILDLSHDSGTIVFVSVMFFLTCFEGVLHSLEHFGGKYGYKGLIMKLYREFMILGFISFAIEISNVVTSFNHANKWFASFNFAHMVILFVGITFLLQSLLLVSLIAQRNKKLLYYDSCTSESLFVEYLQLFEHGYDYLKSLFNYGPVSIPLPELREKIEFKIIQEYFIRSYRLDPKFKFANYMCKVLKSYIISLVEVRPINWFSVAFLVALNYLRILLIDPYYESDVCDRYPRRLSAGGGGAEHHSIHICPDYTLRVVFVALIGITGYMLAVFISSEVYVQRLIGKVLDDEETLEWLDTEEAIEENRKFSSPFPHPLELLNQNETFAANETGGSNNLAVNPTKKGSLLSSPIDPTQATHQRMGSESGVLNSNSINNRRSSIRRSFSYKSPLNDANLHSEPVQEEPVSAPPERGIGTRRRSITLNVPIHKENLPEASRGSIASYEETKAITAEINNFNRRHLYLKCLERIIQVEYSYHEHEARRTSIASEHEAHELGHYSATPGRTPNTGRYKGSSIHSVGAAATPTISTSPESSADGRRIEQLKTMKMKDLRELMLQARHNSLKPDGDGAVDDSEQQEPGGMRRSNSGFLFFASGGGGSRKGSLISSVGGSSGKHKPPTTDKPKKFFDNPLTKKDNNDHSVGDVEMANRHPATSYSDSRRGSADSRGELKRDFTMKFFEFVKSPTKDKKSASTSMENIGNFYQTVSQDSTEPSSSPKPSLPPQLVECFSIITICGTFVYIQLKRFAECFHSHLFGIQHDHHDHNLKKLHTSTHHQHRGSHQRSLDDIKELEADFKAIFLWSNPSYYYLSVEFSLLLQCMYVALWATNFVFMAVNSHFVVLWNIALLLPMLLNFFLLKQIIFSSCLLQSIIKIDINIANKICEEAIEERNVTHRLRRMIRDKLKEISPERKQWKKILYDYYSLKMDVNEEITREEWKDFLYSLNLQLTNSSIRQLFKLIDTDQDDFIHWNDLYMIVFPDFMKKKIKIRKSKKNRRNKHETEDEADEEREESKRSAGYSMEYHISEEDRMSYKKKTNARSSIITSTAQRIRNSLVPRPSNVSLASNASGFLTRNTTVATLQSNEDEGDDNDNNYLVEEKENDGVIILEEPGSSKKSSNDHNDQSPIEERSLLSKTNRPAAAQLRKKTISFDDNLINYSPSQGNTSRPSSGSILRPTGLSITIDGEKRGVEVHSADEPHVPETTSITKLWTQTNEIMPEPSPSPPNTNLPKGFHQLKDHIPEEQLDEDEEEEEEEEDEEEALNQIRERARSRAHSRIIEEHHLPQHHLLPPGSQPTSLQSYLNRKPSTPKFGMFKAFRKTFTNNNLKSKSNSIEEEEEEDEIEEQDYEDEDGNISFAKDYFAEEANLIRRDSAGGNEENNDSELRRRSGSRPPRAYSFSREILEEKEDRPYNDEEEEEEEEEDENSNVSSLEDDDPEDFQRLTARDFFEQRKISSSSPHLRPSSLDRNPEPQLQQSNQSGKRTSIRRSIGPDGVEFEEEYYDI